MDRASLIALLSKEPASLAWSTSEDGTRTIGTSEGFVLDLLEDRVEIAALFPPDQPALAGRNGTLMQLVLLACRPDWGSASAWLATTMRVAARSKRTDHENVNVSRRVVFRFDRLHSRATLRIYAPWTSAPS